MSPSRWSYCLPVLLALGAPAVAQREPELARLTVPDENPAFLERVQLARQFAQEKEFARAVEVYERLLNEEGDRLVPVQAPAEAVGATRRSVQLRRVCYADLARLPAEALAAHRARVEPVARQWLEQATRERDPALLRRVVRDAFATRAAAEALDRLGDLAFERGDFAAALQWWGLLTPLPSRVGVGEEALAAGGDAARVRVKQILSLLFGGAGHEAKEAFAAFARLHPRERGTLAGREGLYVELLRPWLEMTPAEFAWRADWPSFAGDAANNAEVPKLPDRRLWVDGPAWRIPLTAKNAPADRSSQSRSQLARRLRHFPVIAAGQVLIADERSVAAFDLRTGTGRRQFALPDAPPPPDKLKLLEDDEPPPVRFALTVADGHAFAQLGARQPGEFQDGKRQPVQSYLVCLDVRPGSGAELPERWRREAETAGEESAAFAGPPLVYQDRVYAVVERGTGYRLRTSLACYAASDGTPLWERLLFEIPRLEEAERPPAVRLPALLAAGDRVVVCTQRGLVCAVEADRGTPAWAVRYPSRGPVAAEGWPSPREFGPLLLAGGRLFVAPVDADRLLCLDPFSGRVVWERDPLQPVHLLDCHAGRLLFTTRDGLRALDADTGGDTGGWVQPTAGRLPPFGRGLVCAGWVFWPTTDPDCPLRVVNVHDGSQQRGDVLFDPLSVRQILPGNMAFGDGCLVVAGVNELIGYVPQKEGFHTLPPLPKPADSPRAIREASAGTPRLLVDEDHTRPVTVADLPPPLEVVWKQDLGVLLPGAALEDAFACWDGDRLQLVRVDGVALWGTPLPFAPSAVHAHGDALLAAGPGGVVGLNPKSGKLLWGWTVALSHARDGIHWLTPDPWARGKVEPLIDFSPDLSTFRVGSRRRLRLEPASGELTHLNWLPGAPLNALPEAGASAGPEVRQIRVALEGKPLVIEANPNGVRAVEPDGTIALWTFRPRLPTTLTGDLPRVFGTGDVLLTLLHRNYGHDLTRLDPRTGKELWPPGARLFEGAVDPEACAFSPAAVYLPTDDALVAFSLGDGKLLWRKDLPHSRTGWRLCRTADGLLACPAGEPEPRLVFAPVGPLWLSVPVREQRANRPFALRLYSGSDGTLLQEVDLGVTPRGVALQSFPDVVIVSAGGTVWAVRGRQSRHSPKTLKSP